MFDKNLTIPLFLSETSHQHHHHKTKVDVRYATTPEQAMHLDELRKEAWSNITDAMVKDLGNEFKVVTFRRNRDQFNLNDRIVVVFDLNGETHQISADIDTWTETDLAEQVFTAISRKITIKLMEGLR